MQTHDHPLRKIIGLIVLLGLLTPGLAFGQLATIEGTVTSQQNDEPLPGVSVFIEELENAGIGSATDRDGQYSIEVPEQYVRGQEVTVVARFVGYRTGEETITLQAGTEEVNFTLARDVLKLDETVVTGQGFESRKAQVPYAVNKVTEEELSKVPAATNPAEAIQSRVPGATVVQGQGTPGTGPSILLRGVTSVTGDNSPLYVVDGAILDGPVDLDALDVKSIEVVKGSAAAAIYGSRAQNGVIRITTKDGGDIAQNSTQIQIRNEFGFDQLNAPDQRAYNHNRLVAQTSFEDANGNQVEPGDWLRTIEGGEVVKAEFDNANTDFEEWSVGRDNGSRVTFHDNLYPVYRDHQDQIFDLGGFTRNSVAASQRTQDTNFRISGGHIYTQGPVQGARGYRRYNARINVEHDVGNALTFSGRYYFSNSDRDDVTAAQGSASLWPSIYFISPAVDIGRDSTGQYPANPDETNRYENPLYLVNNVSWTNRRQRNTLNARVEYRPLSWLNLRGQFNFQSFNGNFEEFRDKGFETSEPEANLNNGNLSRASDETRSWGANLRATVAQQFLGGLNTRFQLRGRAERTVFESFNAFGSGFAAQGVRDFDNIVDDPEAEDIDANSFRSDTRALYGFLSGDIDWKGRYVINTLVRRDGTTRFGEDERWHSYYRIGGAYRVAQEPWWPLKDQIGEFKLRGSYGTGGGQPGFSAKFQTYNVSSGRISKNQLGNPDLEPSYQTETSVGVDFALFNRVSGSFTYAASRVEDQILNVPLPGYLGWNSQIQNGGTVESYTLEGQLDVSILQGRDLSLTAGGTIGHTQSTIVEFGRSPFRVGQDEIFLYEEGHRFGTFFGNDYINSMSEIPEMIDINGDGELEDFSEFADQFQVNDEGFLVPVGAGNSWRDGIRERLWGTRVDIDGDGEGEFDWGEPVGFANPDSLQAGIKQGNLPDSPIGNGVPDFNFGFNLNFNYEGLNVFMLWGGQYGGEIYNFNRHWANTNGSLHRTSDQRGKSIETKKPASYEGAFSQFNDRYVEDGTFLKLRELAVQYTFDSETLTALFGPSVGNALNNVTLGVTGNELLTFTGYSGWDPEVASPRGGNAVEAVQRVDYFTYPNYRRFTGTVEISF
jgi:TonB-linked SusC/RagA family outer membrane protein